MDRHEAIENHVAADAETDSAVYVPSLQLTQGQPPPIAANGGLSYMSFDRDGDAGNQPRRWRTALAQIAEGRWASAFIDMIDKRAPRRPSDRDPLGTSRSADYDANASTTSARTGIDGALQGGLVLPLALYHLRAPDLFDRVRPMRLWRDPARQREVVKIVAQERGAEPAARASISRM